MTEMPKLAEMDRNDRNFGRNFLGDILVQIIDRTEKFRSLWPKQNEIDNYDPSSK